MVTISCVCTRDALTVFPQIGDLTSTLGPLRVECLEIGLFTVLSAVLAVTQPARFDRSLFCREDYTSTIDILFYF
jgi:hypothetical protein